MAQARFFFFGTLFKSNLYENGGGDYVPSSHYTSSVNVLINVTAAKRLSGLLKITVELFLREFHMLNLSFVIVI